MPAPVLEHLQINCLQRNLNCIKNLSLNDSNRPCGFFVSFMALREPVPCHFLLTFNYKLFLSSHSLQKERNKTFSYFVSNKKQFMMSISCQVPIQKCLVSCSVISSFATSFLYISLSIYIDFTCLVDTLKFAENLCCGKTAGKTFNYV